ncbi:MAG: hypothetical protein J1E31_02070 [Helicobacter sp.]|nr:hypothetical protein [Helicobacter sp.]
MSISIIGMNQYNPVYNRPADSYYANKLLSQYKNIADVVNGRIRGDAKDYWIRNK